MKLMRIYKKALVESDLKKTKFASNASAPTSPVDPETEEESKVVLLINQLEQVPDVIKQLQDLQLLSSKYKAIQQFAALMGIPPENFHQVIQQAKIQSTI